MPDESRPTVLLVDDDEAKRYTIAKVLQRAAFDVWEACSGLECLRLAAARPDLIILDVKLPDVSGFEVCRRLKEDPATSAIPVLHISTTFVDLEDRLHGFESGAEGYLTSVAEPLEIVATVRALLRARRAEEAAHLSTQQWQTTFDAISDGVLLLDREGRVVQVNRTVERILERPWGELIGRHFHALLDPATDDVQTLFERAVDARSRAAVDLERGKSWLQIAVDPIRDGDGVVKGALCLISDITERKRMEEQLIRHADELREGDRRKDEFLAMLAHELRNPLAAISNAVQLTRRGGNDDDVQWSTGVIEEQVSHLTRMMDDLLDVSRITRGKIQLRKQVLDLSLVINHAVETVRPLVDERKHQVTVSVAPGPLRVEADPTRLEQILVNLLNNAAKYTEAGGTVAISARAEGGRVVISIKDNGIGITPEQLPRMFDLFAQADRSLARSEGGLGIGLTLVQSLVELHAGTVTAASDGLGQGSEFTVRLPAPAAEPAAGSRGRASSTPPPQGEGQRILVIDDNAATARGMARLLKLSGYDVDVLHEGRSAVEVAKRTRPDTVLLDIGLPGIDGYEVARQLRQSGCCPDALLIAVSGYGQDEDRRRSREAGLDHHLVKPVDFDALLALIARRTDAQETD